MQMELFDLLAQSGGIALCIVIFWRAESAINRMGKDTLRLVRIAFVLLAVGAAAMVVLILLGAVPSWPSLLICAGVAALLFCERRIRVLTRLRGFSKPNSMKGIHHASR